MSEVIKLVSDDTYKSAFNTDLNNFIQALIPAYMNDVKASIGTLFDNGVDYNVVSVTYGKILQTDEIERLYNEAQIRKEEKERRRLERERKLKEIVLPEKIRRTMEVRIQEVKAEKGEYYAELFQVGYESAYTKERWLDIFSLVFESDINKNKTEEEILNKIIDAFGFSAEEIESILSLREEE